MSNPGKRPAGSKLNDLRCLGLLTAVTIFGLLGLTLLFGPPRPVVHDEFSYLIMGETFANGELARPPHPMADFLSTFHVLQEPAYASKYFPLHGGILALGYALFGAPIFGVWVSVILMGWSFYYVGRSLAGPVIALLGALWGTLHFGVFTYWGHSFWGGTGIALGGALMLGAVLHQRRRFAWIHAGALALGLAATLLSRPFEGFFFGLLLGLYYLAGVIRRARRDGSKATLAGALAVPALGVVVALGCLGAYNRAVTGSVTQFPHSLYQQTYFSEVGRFAWEADAEESGERPERPAEFERFAENSISAPSSFREVVKALHQSLTHWFGYYIPGVVLISLAALALAGRLWRGSVERLLCGLLLLRLPPIFLTGSSLHAHYTAAWAAVSVALVVLASRLLWANRALLREGMARWWRWLWPLGLLLPLGVRAGVMWATDFQVGFKVPVSWTPNHWKLFADRRDAVYGSVVQADAMKGHVILVSYRPGHLVHQEWVYNGAFIDEEPVVWVRDPGPGEREPLLRYFDDRQFWRLEVGAPFDPVELQALPVDTPATD